VGPELPLPLHSTPPDAVTPSPAGKAISSNPGIRIALRVMDDYANNAILGSGVYAAGVRATDFTTKDKGIAWLVGVDEEPIVAKSYNITTGMAARIGERARKLREQAGRLSGHAIGVQADRAPAYDLLADVRRVMAETGQDWIWSQTAIEQLANLRTDVYRGWTVETLALKARQVITNHRIHPGSASSPHRPTSRRVGDRRPRSVVMLQRRRSNRVTDRRSTVNVHPLILAVVVGAALTGCGVAAARPSLDTSSAASVPVATRVPSATGCTIVDGRADTRCTPGARNPQVTQLNIASTICKSGWTATIRPPVSYTDKLKAQDMPRYGETGPASDYELDHLIPLEIGGNPTDPANLWPEPWNGARGAHVKDPEETSLKRAVCGGRLKLADAQAQILRDWTHP
jgi:hypothetical protein